MISDIAIASNLSFLEPFRIRLLHRWINSQGGCFLYSKENLRLKPLSLHLTTFYSFLFPPPEKKMELDYCLVIDSAIDLTYLDSGIVNYFDRITFCVAKPRSIKCGFFFNLKQISSYVKGRKITWYWYEDRYCSSFVSCFSDMSETQKPLLYHLRFFVHPKRVGSYREPVYTLPRFEFFFNEVRLVVAIFVSKLHRYQLGTFFWSKIQISVVMQPRIQEIWWMLPINLNSTGRLRWNETHCFIRLCAWQIVANPIAFHAARDDGVISFDENRGSERKKTFSIKDFFILIMLSVIHMYMLVCYSSKCGFEWRLHLTSGFNVYQRPWRVRSLFRNWLLKQNSWESQRWIQEGRRRNILP